MAQINPTVVQWTAPTANIDGTAISEPLSYRLMVDGVDFLDFPGTLNPDGHYTEDTAPMGLPDGLHELALKAFYVTQPLLISDPSNTIEILVGVEQPNPPINLEAF